MAKIKPVKLAFKIIDPSVNTNKSSVILLHGITDCKEVFDDIANNLANKIGRKLYALDLRNHGDSDHSTMFSMEAMSIDVINFMDEHNIESAVILGHSLGGRLAMHIALTYSNRVESIIVEDMSPKAIENDIIEGYADLMKIMSDSIDIIPTDTDIEAAINIIFENISKKKSENILLNTKSIPGKIYPLPLQQKDSKYVWKTNFPVIQNIKNLKFHENLQGLYEKPALFIYGTLSEFNLYDDKEFILKLFPSSHLYGLPTSHNVHYEASDEYVEIVSKFLK